MAWRSAHTRWHGVIQRYWHHHVKSVIWLLPLCMMLAGLSPAHASERCGVPEPVDTLINTVSRVAAVDGRLSPVALKTLRDELIRAERVLIIAGSDDLGLGGWKPSFDRLLEKTREAVDNGQFNDPQQVRAQVGALIVGLRFSCAPASHSKRNAHPSKGARDGITGFLQNLFGLRNGRPDTTGQSVELLVAVLGMTLASVGVIWGGDQLYRKIYARIFNRHSCRIHGAIEIGLDVVDGNIVILGMNGARFQPVNDGAFNRIEQSVANGGASLLIGPHRIPFEIFALRDGKVSGFFDAPIPLAMLQKLLAASVIPPQYSAQRIQKRNIG